MFFKSIQEHCIYLPFWLPVTTKLYRDKGEENVIIKLHNYLRRTAKVMFSSLLVRFVCLSVSNIAGKRIDGFS